MLLRNEPFGGGDEIIEACLLLRQKWPRDAIDPGPHEPHIGVCLSCKVARSLTNISASRSNRATILASSSGPELDAMGGG